MEASESFLQSIQVGKERYNVVNREQVSSLQEAGLIISVLVNLHNSRILQFSNIYSTYLTSKNDQFTNGHFYLKTTPTLPCGSLDIWSNSDISIYV